MSDPQARTKKYTSRMQAIAQVEADLRERVRTGVWAAGMLLPSRRDLADELAVDLNTIQRAIAPLLKDNTLRADGGRGTFVSESREWPGTAAGQPAAANIDQATLGLIYSLYPGATDVGSFWTRLATRGVEEVFARSTGTILSRNRKESGDQCEPVGHALHALRDQGADGIVVIAINEVEETAEEVIESIDLARTPVVYTSWHAVRPPLAHVYYDSGHEGYLAAQHLIERGYRRIVFIKPYNAYWVDGRIEGARQAVRDARLGDAAFMVYPPVTGAISEGADNDLLGYDAMQSAFRAGIGLPGEELGPWGAITANDYTAFGLIRAISDAGLRLGQDIGLVGFDDDPLSGSLGLTTVRRPFETLGQAAAEMLLRELRGDRSNMQVRLRSHLIPRTSTRLISAAPRRYPSGTLKETTTS